MTDEFEPSDHDRFGEQAEWGHAIPALYRSLSAPRSRRSLPLPPTAQTWEPEAGAYWVPLLHLMLYSLGWANPARGLRWWYGAGHPESDRHLRLMQRVWRQDGQLDWFVTWLWDSPRTPPSERTMPGRPAEPTALARMPDEWFAERYREAEASGVTAPIGGGYDPLHLSAHCGGPLRRPPFAPSIRHNDLCTRVTFPSMVGWYRALNELHIDGALEVHITTLGTLGTFRRSPATERWHATTERIHLAGS